MKNLIPTLICLFLVIPCQAGIITVDDDGPADFNNIQAAIDDSNNGDTIIVEDGTYIGTGNRDIDFLGKAITVRGATGDPNDCVINCQGDVNEPHRGFKFVSGEDGNSVLEAITITNGYGLDENISGFMRSVGGAIYCNSSCPTINNCIISSNSVSHYGGGVYNYNSSPTVSNCAISNNSAATFGGGVCNRDNSSPIITNCTISNNSATHYGGGIYNYSSSSPTIINCTISNNSASTYGGGIYNNDSSPSISNCIISDNSAYFGGGIENYDSSNPTISNCKFSNNSAIFSGGGIENYNSYPSINDCTISDNSTAAWGGGICNRGSYPIISNCAILNNSATHYGGGIFNYSSIPTITKCAISNNASSYGGGISNATSSVSNIKNCTLNNNSATSSGGGVYAPSNTITISNCIIWGNQPSQIVASATVSYSDIQGGYTGVGNININPLFVDEYHISPASPCFDAGDPNYVAEPNETDIDGDPRVMVRIDMGADEVYSSTSPLLIITPGILNFEAQGLSSPPQPQYVSIKNYGAEALNWQILEQTCNWLSVFPSVGQVNTGESIDVEITVNLNIAGYGIHSCQLQVTAPDAENSPQTVTVNLEVLGPEIGLSQTDYFFTTYQSSDGEVDSQELMITNTGYDTINWQIEVPNDCNWLDIEPLQGQCTSETDVAVLTVDPEGLAKGLYTCEVLVSDVNANNSPVSIVVTLYIPRYLYVPMDYTTIQEAINAALTGDIIVVQPGTYTGDGNRDIDFFGKAITVRSTDPNDPNIVAATIIDCNGTETEPHNGFLFLSGEDANCVLSGFTIINGYVFTPWGGFGGGICCYQSSPTIINCMLNENSVYVGGGGMANYDNSSPTVINCTFSGNSADSGGGMSNDWHCSPTLTNCTFADNSASKGGGMLNNLSSPTLINCTFSGNSADNDGGGMLNYNNSSPTVINCTFIGNSAGDYGGGINNSKGSDPTVTNCTFSGNFAEWGGGMFNWESSSPTLTNSILWGNSAPTGPEIFNDNSTPTVTYSNIAGSYSGTGNINADPCFVNPGYWVDANDPNIVVEPNDSNAIWIGGDYHLKSEGWRWDMQRKVWTWDDVTSRCIDAGNPGCPLGDELLSVPDDPNNKWGENLRINMGAYGGTAEASMPPYDWALLADLTNDGKVNLNDLAAFVNYWLDSGECIPSDLSRNQFVDFIDFVLLGQDWFLETSWYTP